MSRVLLLWGGDKVPDAEGWWTNDAVAVFDWDTQTFKLDGYRRHGENENWAEFAELNSQHFSNLDCTNARWGNCGKSNLDSEGHELMFAEVDHMYECADVCANTANCILYVFEQDYLTKSDCYLKSAANEKAPYLWSPTVGYMSNCYHHWPKAVTIQKP